jgi:hypothetical protein
LSPTGIDARAATVEADSLPKLRWIRSSFDFLPVIRSLVHDAARARHDETKMKAAIETRGKLCSEVRTRLENDINPRIADFNHRWEKRVAAPLSQLDIEPQIVEATTTAQRMTLRLRMAADDQLAGFAPRPRASADSLASLQVHQSALNNLAERLEWAGRKLSAREMVRVVAQQCDMDATTIIEKLPEDLAVTFASEDPIRVRCQEGRIELTIALASLEKPPQVWRDFEVRVFYKPDPTSTKGLLKRDGVVQLIGDRLGPKAQIALRGIFSKTFPQGRGIQLLADDVDPRFADLQVTQFEIRDGWIGLAVGGTPLPATEVARETSTAKSR